MTQTKKANVLVVGFGGIGTVTAYNLEAGGQAAVTGVLRSNYDVVNEKGFRMWSFDHGDVASWKPSKITRSVPNVEEEGLPPFDFIVVCTKNIPDVRPTVTEIIGPAITPGITSVVLVQNGVNIERPVIAAYPTTPVVSGVARTSSSELKPGRIFHQEHDTMVIGPFRNPNLPVETEQAAARRFADLYNASGKATGEYNEDTDFVRWRKLVYNASFNSLCTITGMDTSSFRLAQTPITELLRPVMMEIKSIARAVGVKLPADQEDVALDADHPRAYFKPSMLQDIEKNNFIEYEVIVGEPLREAQKHGVPAPTLQFVYSLLKTLQTRTKQRRGLADLPPMLDYGVGDIVAKLKADETAM